MKGHFYYSEKQHRQSVEMAHRGFCSHQDNYAVIDGKTVLYSEWQSGENKGSNWEDAVYLGYGTYSHAENRIEEKHNVSLHNKVSEFLTFAKEKLEEKALDEWPEIIYDET